MACRRISSNHIFGDKGPGIFINSDIENAFLNSHLSSYILRSISPALQFRTGYLNLLPSTEYSTYPELLIRNCTSLKRHLVACDPTERSFTGVVSDRAQLDAIAALLHTLEGINEAEVFAAYGVAGDDMQAVLDETGVPAGFHPLLAGYDALPDGATDSTDTTDRDQIILSGIGAIRAIRGSDEMARLKARLRALYEAGPGTKEATDNTDTMDKTEMDLSGIGAIGGIRGLDEADAEEATVAGAHIPIPTETFLEELSVKMQLHPISIYWLLEELRAEGARCKPEEQRLLEDRLSVLALRLLGHRWPRELTTDNTDSTDKTELDLSEIRAIGGSHKHIRGSIEADADGIIPLVHLGTSETTLAERLRARLRDEDGDLGVQRVEALLAELTGLNLEEWVRREFFKRHVRQFKYRPVAWHLASTPPATGKGRKGPRRLPAFECLLYYHACGGDALARLRTQYVEPQLRAERQRIEEARRAGDETTAAIATERAQELEAFAARLRLVADEGFATPDLDKLLATEVLDRWSGDGYLGPVELSDLQRQERAWRVDLNDGVRVNIAPLQLAGLLVSDVLKAPDARKALADRARWRSDERRWVREGKLPRCGWMDEAAPECPRWTAFAPQREAERAKLEAKRRAALSTSDS